MMNQTRTLLLSSFLLVAFSICINAQVNNTENTLKLADAKASPKATISDMEWIAGNWLGSGLGGVSEEIWSRPQGGVMIGTYRLIVNDKPVFYEMMMLTEKEGSLILRLKHFDPAFVGWEEKDKTVDFKFVSKSSNRVYFSGLTFERTNSNELRIYLALKQKDGSVVEELFTMKRN